MLLLEQDENIAKYVSIDEPLERFLDKEVNKDEDGKREETYSKQIKRLLKVK